MVNMIGTFPDYVQMQQGDYQIPQGKQVPPERLIHLSDPTVAFILGDLRVATGFEKPYVTGGIRTVGASYDRSTGRLNSEWEIPEAGEEQDVKLPEFRFAASIFMEGDILVCEHLAKQIGGVSIMPAGVWVTQSRTELHGSSTVKTLFGQTRLKSGPEHQVVDSDTARVPSTLSHPSDRFTYTAPKNNVVRLVNLWGSEKVHAEIAAMMGEMARPLAARIWSKFSNVAARRVG